MNPVTLHEQWQAVAACTRVGDSIITYQRKCSHQYLSCIAGVCQTFRITRHGCVEYYLSGSVRIISERPADEHCTIFEY